MGLAELTAKTLVDSCVCPSPFGQGRRLQMMTSGSARVLSAFYVFVAPGPSMTHDTQ